MLVAWQRAFAAEYRRRHRGPRPGDDRLPRRLRKFFLTASPEERARRRHAESRRPRRGGRPDEVLREQPERDARDEARAIAPLKPAADARVIDTTGLALDEVADLIERDLLVTRRSAGRGRDADG